MILLLHGSGHDGKSLIDPWLPLAKSEGIVPRKIPMAIWVGTDDNFFPLAAVRQTRDALNAHGFNAQLTEIKNHTHDYYGSSADINKQAWAFLRQHTLAADPRFQSYDVRK